MHRLEAELKELITSDSSISDFIQDECLDGLWYWDLENPEEEYLNDKFWLTLGYNPKEKKHLASEWQDIINKDDLNLAFENFELHCANPAHPYDQIVRYQHKDGSTVWIRCKGVAIRNEEGKPIRMLGIHNDVTQIKNAEQELRETLVTRDRFFARMSHEIRTPLHGIIGLADIVKTKNQDPELDQFINTINSCGEQLQILLDDLLTVSAIIEDSLSISVEEVNLQSVIAYVADLYRPKAQAKGLEFKLVMPHNIAKLNILTDAVRLNQILSNVISNAIKFTREGQITIRVKENAGKAEISIIDTGRGIEDLDKALKPYRQEKPELSNILGAGLGLDIVKGLCDKMHHALHIDSTVGRGTKVTLSCKIAQISQAKEKSSDSKPQFGKVGKVLIVDDNDINLEIAKLMLSDIADEIDCATNGQEAIIMVSEAKDYEAILMDLNMPIKDGFDATHEILSMKFLVQYPRIFAVTADAFESTIAKCQEAGMAGHITKPFTREKLYQALSNQLDSYQSYD